MGFAARVRDLLTGGSGKHQKQAHGARGAQAHGPESGQDGRTDQAAWHAAPTPAADHTGQAAGREDQTAAAADPAGGTAGQDERPPSTVGQD